MTYADEYPLGEIEDNKINYEIPRLECLRLAMNNLAKGDSIFDDEEHEYEPDND